MEWLNGIMILPALVGLFTFYHLFRTQKAPADTSNRIAAIRLWWFALTREDKFAQAQDENGEWQFWWLRQDELDNINQHLNRS